MTASAEPSLLARTLDWIKARISRDNELAAMSRSDLQFLATDIGLTEADLRDVVQQISDHSELMDRMLNARGLNPRDVRLAFRGVIREMEVTCVRCRDVGICRMELEAGTAGRHSHEFCPNAGLMDELLAARR
jgi:hypothetical protein